MSIKEEKENVKAPSNSSHKSDVSSKDGSLPERSSIVDDTENPEWGKIEEAYRQMEEEDDEKYNDVIGVEF